MIQVVVDMGPAFPVQLSPHLTGPVDLEVLIPNSLDMIPQYGVPL
jgi:hypothetical protein